MEDFKVRMLDEANSLWAKINNLEKFLTTNEFANLSWKVRISTRLQLFVMRRYYFWLSQRINLLCTPEDIAEYNNPVVVATEAAVEVEAPKKVKSKKKSKKKVSNE